MSNGMPSTYFKAEDVRVGQDTIIERTPRGTVLNRFDVFAKLNCDNHPGNIHLIRKDGKVRCYERAAQVEIL